MEEDKDITTVDLEIVDSETGQVDTVAESGDTAVKHPVQPEQNVSTFQMFRNLKHLSLQSMNKGGPGVVVLNDKGNEIANCQIPRLEDREPGQAYSIKDNDGNTLLVARRGLNESINVTSGTGNIWMGRLKAPTFGRSFYFSLVSHTDHQLRIGLIEFDRRKGICMLNLTAAENELNLNEKTIALICSVGIILFEWYFRKAELGHHGRRGSICLLSYIAFICLLLVTVGTVFFISLHLF